MRAADKEPIVGRAVRRRSSLRQTEPVRDLDAFLDFLRRLRAMFGPIERSLRPTVGEHFRL